MSSIFLYVSQSHQVVEIDYTNWRGKRSKRKIVPLRISFESNEFHPKTQWLLEAVDLDKQVSRTFAMQDIHSWKPIERFDMNEQDLIDVSTELLEAQLRLAERNMKSSTISNEGYIEQSQYASQIRCELRRRKRNG